MRVYDALIKANAERVVDAHHLRRRRHRRPRRLRRCHLPARHRAGPRADHAAGAGRQLDRRQGRRQPSARQEPDRRLLPAARRGCRPVGARHAAAPRIPRRALRGDQVRHHLQPHTVRTRGEGSSRDLQSPARRAHLDHRRSVPHQGRRGHRRTKRNRVCAASSTSATLPGTRSSRSRSIAASATAKRSATACSSRQNWQWRAAP